MAQQFYSWNSPKMKNNMCPQKDLHKYIINSGYEFWVGKPHKWFCVLLSTLYQEAQVSVCHANWWCYNFDHLVRMVSARFLLYKVILFPLLLISNMWVAALRLERYIFPDDSSPIDGFRFTWYTYLIHYYYYDCKMVILYLHHSFYIS